MLLALLSTFSDSGVQSLSNDELYFLMLRRTSNNISEQYTQTFSFVEKLATTKIQDDLKSLVTELDTQLKSIELERRVDRKLVQLHKFEVSAMINLLRAEETTIEEVLSWIPSLARYSEEHVVKAINMVVEAKQKYVESNAG